MRVFGVMGVEQQKLAQGGRAHRVGWNRAGDRLATASEKHARVCAPGESSFGTQCVQGASCVCASVSWNEETRDDCP